MDMETSGMYRQNINEARSMVFWSEVDISEMKLL